MIRFLCWQCRSGLSDGTSQEDRTKSQVSGCVFDHQHGPQSTLEYQYGPRELLQWPFLLCYTLASVFGLLVMDVKLLLVISHIIIFHYPPVSPLEYYNWWSAVYFKNFPGKCWHHTLESLMTRCKIGSLWRIVLVRSDDGIVSANFKHMFSRLRRTAIYRECVLMLVNGSPISDLGLERCLNFPILDQVLDKVRKTSRGMRPAFGC